MAKRDELIARARKRDFAAVDALAAEGTDALDEVIEAIAGSNVSTADTLGEVVRRMPVSASVSVSRFLVPEAALETFLAAVDVLSRNGDPNGELQRFVETTPADFETHRGVAVIGMAKAHDPKVSPFIKTIAAEADKEKRPLLFADCVEALTMVGDHTLDERAGALVRSRDPEVKLRGGGLLPYLFFPALYELLGAASRQRNDEVRAKAVDALYYLGTKTAADMLLKISRDRDPSVREEAVASLVSITGGDPDPDRISDATALDKLSDDLCWRMGEPIDLAKLAKGAELPHRRADVAEELRVETGYDFGFNASRPQGDPEFVGRISAWLEINGVRFEKGGCYKFGFRQDLSSLV